MLYFRVIYIWFKSNHNFTCFLHKNSKRRDGIVKQASRLDWIRFGVEGFLLSIIGSAACGCANELYASYYDVFNVLSPVLLGVGVVLLIVGIAGAALAKGTE